MINGVPPPECRAAVIAVVSAALAGDTTAAEAVIDHAYENPSWTREFIHASLTLCHAMAQRLHRPAGMLLLYQAITNARDAPHLHQRLAAQLILGHAEIQPTLDASGIITAAETHAELFNCGAELVNDAITASGDRFDETLLAALKLWVQLLPEFATPAGREWVNFVADEIWPPQ